MRILGLDLSSKSTGAAIIEDGKLIAYTTITASSTDVVKRIQKIVKELEQFINNNKPIDKVLIEEVRPDGGLNIQTYKTLMWVQAAVAFMLHDNCNPAIEYIYPTSWRSKLKIKQGKGIKRASLKEADIEFVKNTFNVVTNDDAADAICIALSYFKEDRENLAW